MRARWSRFLTLLLVVAFLAPSMECPAALSASTVWEVRGTGGIGPGSDANGGGFVAGSGGTDYSQQNAAQLTETDLATTGVVTTLTSATGGFTAAMVGNIINIASGTNFTAGLYQILTFVNTNTITLDRAPTTAAGSAGTGSVGGAFATLGKLVAALTLGSNKAYCTGAFTTTATLTFVPSGVTPSGSVPQTRLIGYGSVRGDSGHATLTLQTNTGLTGILCAASGFVVENIDVDCGGLGTSTGISLTAAFSGIRNCKAANFTLKGLRVGANGQAEIVDCEVTGGTATATAAIEDNANPSVVARCYVHDNLCTGISTANTNGYSIHHNLVVNNTGATSDGILLAQYSDVYNNTVFGSGRDGIRCASGTATVIQIRNNILAANGVSATGYGLNNSVSAGPATPDIDGNAYYNNNADITSGHARNNCDSTAGIYGVAPYTNVRDVILTASPFIGPTTGSTANFGLNNTAGGGRSCRRAGSPGPWPGNTGTTGFLDMGAVQSKGGSRVEIIR